MALPEVLITSTFNAGPPVNVNEFTPRKGVSLSATATDPALTAANPGPIPTSRPIMGQSKYLIDWIGNNGQATQFWVYTNATDRDAEYTAIATLIGAPSS